jgi:hypothetical protein
VSDLELFNKVVVKNLNNENIAESWIKNLRKQNFPSYCNDVIYINYNEFVSLISKPDKELWDLIKRMSTGTVLIAKNALNKIEVQTIKKRTMNFFQNTPSTFFRVQEGVENFHRKIDQETGKKYGATTARHSAYTFPWNNDDTGCRKEIMKVWSNVKKFSGLNAQSYETNTPINGVVDRIQVALYPRKEGFLNCHVDPFHNQLTFISLYLSKRGDGSYSEGGFFSLNKYGNKVDLEKNIDEGDLGLGVGTIKHGVSQIDSYFNGKIDWNGPSGRWFLGLYSNDSDHVKNRITVKDAQYDETKKFASRL